MMCDLFLGWWARSPPLLEKRPQGRNLYTFTPTNEHTINTSYPLRSYSRAFTIATMSRVPPQSQQSLPLSPIAPQIPPLTFDPLPYAAPPTPNPSYPQRLVNLTRGIQIRKPPSHSLLSQNPPSHHKFTAIPASACITLILLTSLPR